MYLIKKTKFQELLIILLIAFYASFINWLSANIGVLPIDSFGFFDTGYSILLGKLPIKDFWIFTGLTVDYMEAFFLLIFGNNWISHVIHASLMNSLATICFYYFLKKININRNFSIFYCFSFATLCYPVSGTPFAYFHSYIFSIISIFILILGINYRQKISWTLLPIFCFLAFLSMQTPSAYIIIIILIFSILFFLKEKNNKFLKKFIFSSVGVVLFFLFFLLITKTPIDSFIYQYILFPLTIGEGRLASEGSAYVSLIDQLNLKRIFFDFKFIQFLLVPLILLLIVNLRKKLIKLINFNLIIILSTILFIFNQLLTANQIFIFSLIPVLASIIHLNIIKLKYSPKIILVLVLIVTIATVKFHYRYNIDRKFHDLENIDKSKAIDAKFLSNNLKGLKWININNLDPRDELMTIKNAMNIIRNDNREKILITHYQFLSTILEQDLNIINRWYLWDNNTHPTENHKYFKVYKKMIDKKLKKNDIEVIYLLGQENEILFNNVKNYFTNVCFISKSLEKNKFSVHVIKTCN